MFVYREILAIPWFNGSSFHSNRVVSDNLVQSMLVADGGDEPIEKVDTARTE